LPSSVVIDVQNSYIYPGIDQSENDGFRRTITVIVAGRAMKLAAGGAQDLAAGGALDLAAGGAIELPAGGAMDLAAGGAMELPAGSNRPSSSSSSS